MFCGLAAIGFKADWNFSERRLNGRAQGSAGGER
jgi:hypothetical protein